jgi:Ca2+-binding EF-hand superfamily protein
MSSATAKKALAPSQREVEDEVRLFFNRFDTDLSGHIDRQEVPRLLKHIGVANAMAYVDEFMKQFEDPNDKASAGKRISFAAFKSKVSPPTGNYQSVLFLLSFFSHTQKAI